MLSSIVSTRAELRMGRLPILPLVKSLNVYDLYPQLSQHFGCSAPHSNQRGNLGCSNTVKYCMLIYDEILVVCLGNYKNAMGVSREEIFSVCQFRYVEKSAFQ